MPKIPPKKAHIICWVMLPLGVVVGTLGSLLEIWPLAFGGMAILIVIPIFRLIFYCCPYCRRYLDRSRGDHCPYCGERID